jgi:hypothetical protein
MQGGRLKLSATARAATLPIYSSEPSLRAVTLEGGAAAGNEATVEILPAIQRSQQDHHQSSPPPPSSDAWAVAAEKQATFCAGLSALETPQMVLQVALQAASEQLPPAAPGIRHRTQVTSDSGPALVQDSSAAHLLGPVPPMVTLQHSKVVIKQRLDSVRMFKMYVHQVGSGTHAWTMLGVRVRGRGWHAQ